MKIEELKPMMDLLVLLTPRESEERVEEIKMSSNDRVGEFKVRLRPSDCLMLIKTQRDFKAKIEEAQLAGKTEI